MFAGSEIKETFPRDSLFIKLDTRADRWAVPYHYEALNARVDNLIIKNKKAIEKKRILDLGCHFGTFAYAALHHGAAYVHGIDAESALIRKAENIFRQNNVPPASYRFSVSDIVPFMEEQADESYDTVLCLGVYYYLNDPFHALSLMNRIAKKHIILDTFTAYYGACMSKEAGSIFRSMGDEAFELPLVLFPQTQSKKGDYVLKSSFMNKKKKQISLLSLPSVAALEYFFELQKLDFNRIQWDQHASSGYTWKDFVHNDVKKSSHWADAYHAQLRVSYILSKN